MTKAVSGVGQSVSKTRRMLLSEHVFVCVQHKVPCVVYEVLDCLQEVSIWRLNIFKHITCFIARQGTNLFLVSMPEHVPSLTVDASRPQRSPVASSCSHARCSGGHFAYVKDARRDPGARRCPPTSRCGLRHPPSPRLYSRLNSLRCWC